jgi:hypothetical protein
VNIAPDKSDASTEEIKMVKIDLYVERMSFKYDAAYPAASGQTTAPST